MAQDKAATIPEIPWENGNADVIPLPGDSVETLPLENVSEGRHTVKKDEYPNGKVLIPPTQPVGNYAILPLVICDRDEEKVEVGPPKNPNGVVILFRS